MNDGDDRNVQAWTMQEGTTQERAEQHLLAMAMTDTQGQGALGLQARILARLGAEHPLASARSPRWLAAAALLLFGTAAVFGVSFATRDEEPTTNPAPAWAQDPAPKKPDTAVPKVTDAQVPKRANYSFADRPALDCLVEIAKANDLPLVSVVSAFIEKPIRLELASATPIQALAAAARAAGAHLEMYGAVLTIVPDMHAEERLVTLRRDATNIGDLLAIVAKEAHANLVISPDVAGRATVDVTQCPWRDLVALLAEAADAEVVGFGAVLNVRPKSKAAAPRVFFAYDRTPTTEVLDTIGKISGKAVIAEGEITGSVTVRVKNQPALDVQQAIAATQKCMVVEVSGTPVWRRPQR